VTQQVAEQAPQPRVRRAVPDDALVVAALTLQCARHRGTPAEPGFLDRFASAWLATGPDHPVWVAECGGEHAGYLLTSRHRPLPWPGDRGGGGSLMVEQFFVRPQFRNLKIGELLLTAARDWARAEGLSALQMRPGRHTRSLCERVGLADTGDLMELRLGDHQ
jgi:GNAT superfamily N-acetyltransferase